MIAKIKNPVVLGVFSVLLSVGLGVSACWRTLSIMLARSVVVAPKPEVEELKQKGWDFWTIEIDNLSNELKEERARLRKKSESLDQREARLAAEEKEFARLRADVDTLRKQIGEKVVEIGADEAKNIRSLAQTYANLTPRGAVAILRELDDGTAVKILALMKPDIVGAIFEEMSHTGGPEAPLARRAALLSEKLRLMKSTKSGNAS